VRDASGNVMSIYAKDAAINTGALTQTEISMYGSGRLGVWNINRNVVGIAAIDYSIFNSNFTRGNKLFELSNHLGNVLVTVSDKKLAVSANGTTVDYYNADVVTANDYYPFGSQMPGRKYSQPNAGYRYGFNGKEQDNETVGTSTYDYGFRIYNPSLGRFLSVDPLTNKYPMLTPYQFASNTPIQAIDLDGLEAISYVFNVTRQSNGDVLIKVSDIRINFQVLNLSSTPDSDLRIDEITRGAKGIIRSNLIGTKSGYINTLFSVKNKKVIQNKEWKRVKITYEVDDVTVTSEKISSKSQIKENTPLLVIVDGYNNDGYAGLAPGLAATVKSKFVSQTSDAVFAPILAAHELFHTIGAEDDHTCTGCLMASGNDNTNFYQTGSTMSEQAAVTVLESLTGVWQRLFGDMVKAKLKPEDNFKVEYKGKQSAEAALDTEINAGVIKTKR
jgi:RHS repeat-associated protein